MSVIAAASYLRALREAQELSQEDVAREVGVSLKQVWRWERGENEPTSTALAALITCVKGDPGHVTKLLMDKDATEEDGQRLASVRLSQSQRGRIDAIVDEYGEEVRTILAELRSNPSRLSRWLGYGRSLADDPDAR